MQDERATKEYWQNYRQREAERYAKIDDAAREFIEGALAYLTEAMSRREKEDRLRTEMLCFLLNDVPKNRFERALVKRIIQILERGSSA